MDSEVVLGEYDTFHEAELTAAYLREHGVLARVHDNSLSNLNPLWGMVVGGVRVFVPIEQGRLATELVSELKALDRLERKEREGRGDPEHKRVESDATARRALAAAVIGFFLLPVLSQFYSLWLISQLDATALSRRGRRYRLFALVVNLAVLGGGVVLIFR